NGVGGKSRGGGDVEGVGDKVKVRAVWHIERRIESGGFGHAGTIRSQALAIGHASRGHSAGVTPFRCLGRELRRANLSFCGFAVAANSPIRPRKRRKV